MLNLTSIKNLPIISESISIDVIPTSLGGHTEDIAKVTASIRLANPLAEETKFIIPKADGIAPTKIYLPDGTKILQGQIDATAEGDVGQIPALIQTAINNFIGNPVDENMNEAVKLMSAFHDFKTSGEIITIPAGTRYITFNYSKWIPKNDDESFTLETVVPFVDFTINGQPGAKANIIVLMPLEITDTSKILEAQWTTPNGQPQDLNKTNIDGRIGLSQHWQYDPAVHVKYRY